MRKCNNLFRTIVLLLLMSIVLSSCASGATDNEDTTVSSDVTTQTVTGDRLSQLYRDMEDSVPELDFGGETIRFLTLKNRSDVTGQVYNDEIWVEELTSDPLNDAIYNRNMYVMDRLNCKIVNDIKRASEVREDLDKMIGADDEMYHVVGYEAAEALALSLDGGFYDLTSLETDYIDFDAPWWSGQFFDAVAPDDRVYVLAGSLSLSMIRSINATFFNKAIAEEERIEDLYTVVKEGRWTIDYQTELTSGMYRDLNGNDTKDIDDRYGYATAFYWAVDAYWSAFDINILSRNNDGEFEFVLNEEKAFDGFNKIFDLSYSSGAHGENINDDEVEELFASGKTFMITQKLASAETTTFRNMQHDYGIIPMPMFDEKQKEYYSMPYEIFQTYMIPCTTQNTAMATAVLEVLSAETWRKIIPVYSELVLKGKYLSDPQSREMFDMIIENTRIDAGLMYYRKIGEIGSHLYRFPIERNKPDSFTATLESKKRLMKTYIKELNRQISAQ